MFWFGDLTAPFAVWSADRFENRAYDHLAFGSRGSPVLEMEITLLSWRNHFTADVYGEHGSAHIESLCKWGPSSFIRRTRILPSGRPPEEAITLVQADPTWSAEYEFVGICPSKELTCNCPSGKFFPMVRHLNIPARFSCAQSFRYAGQRILLPHNPSGSWLVL